MKWVTDKSGRFKKRPHYTQEELDLECEKIIQDFLIRKYNKISFPISTEDLTVLIEEKTQDFDSSADLTDEGDDVEGVTYFQKGEKPIVKISNKIQDGYLENRLRTTLTHELFHVLFHNLLYQIEETPSLFDIQYEKFHKCKRDTIITASSYDWMEWQAGYGCGAFLMPINSLKQTVLDFKENLNIHFEHISVSSNNGQALIQKVAQSFQTSIDAARVRLLQQRFLQDNNQNQIKGLF